MTTLFITRHPGAVEWADRQGLHIDQRITLLGPVAIQSGDVVIGTLAVNLAAEVGACGGRFSIFRSIGRRQRAGGSCRPKNWTVTTRG
jgi:putative CRISPR-associated protein (TIGR02620 family)